jgi:hypothetical protein
LRSTVKILCRSNPWSDYEKDNPVTPLEEKKVAVVFSDGLSGVFDVAPYIRSDFFKRLEDDAYFKW